MIVGQEMDPNNPQLPVRSLRTPSPKLFLLPGSALANVAMNATVSGGHRSVREAWKRGNTGRVDDGAMDELQGHEIGTSNRGKKGRSKSRNRSRSRSKSRQRTPGAGDGDEDEFQAVAPGSDPSGPPGTVNH